MDDDGNSLFHHAGFRFALYPNQAGRAPDLEDAGSLEQLGRLVARLHNVGALRRFEHRPSLDIESLGEQSRTWLLEQGFIPEELIPAYETLTADLLDTIHAVFAQVDKPVWLRLHGDCHPGNILWADDGPHFVDLDDARNGPAIQDLWMFVTGDREEMTARLADLLEGYTQFRDFDPRELHLIEALRTLRMIHHAAWLARRWQDPAFPMAFPWFNTQRYWGDHILALREQAALLQEPPLYWD
jgi:Ser/Thr protein kinase RdoA (MazF antagonist)